MNKPNVNLKDKFIQNLQMSCQAVFSTKEALTWYKLNKNNPGRVDYSNLYTLIINPLLAEGRIKKILKGLYEVTVISSSNLDLQIEGLDGQETLSNEDKEFLEYLKLKGA
jgi:hypothetical protein